MMMMMMTPQKVMMVIIDPKKRLVNLIKHVRLSTQDHIPIPSIISRWRRKIMREKSGQDTDTRSLGLSLTRLLIRLRPPN